MKNTAFLLLLLCLFSVKTLSAQAPVKKLIPLRFLIAGALELGGDRVATVYFVNGNTQSVRAGQGGTLSIGAQYQLPTLPRLLFRGTAGIKYVTTAADNAHIRLTRFPIQLTANYMALPKLRIGAGWVTHQSITFKADGLGRDVTFSPSNGAVMEVAYAGVGLSYTLMRYRDQDNNVYSANAIGLIFSIAIPGK
jgi:hypothetical protein